MPLLKLETTVPLPEEKGKPLLSALSKVVAGRSEQICKLLKDSLGIAPDRVYLNFTDVEAGNWGWNEPTFG